MLALALGVIAFSTIGSAATAPASAAQGTSTSWAITAAEKKMAQEIVSHASQISGSSFLTLMSTAYKDGKVMQWDNGGVYGARSCFIDGRVLAGLHHLLVDKGYSLELSSTNRWCDRTGPLTSTKSANSMHWAAGGGGAVDISKFKAPGSSTWVGLSSANYKTYDTQINTLIDNFLSGSGAATSAASVKGNWQIGQGQCRTGYSGSTAVKFPSGTWANKGYWEFVDSCDHIHISYYGPDRTYPMPANTANDECFCNPGDSRTYTYLAYTGGSGSTGGTGGLTPYYPPTPPYTPPPAPAALTVGTSGNWWLAAHWKSLATAIGISYNGDSFGHSPWDRLYGTYSTSAKSLQTYLNAHDGGKTTNVGADGYWGPTTTEKLRAVIDNVCGQTPKLYIYGAIDGKGANGTTFQFNQDEGAALAKCLNAGRF